MTCLPACDAAYALFHEIAAWIDDVAAGVRDFDDFADTVAGRLIPVADAARDEARAMGEKVAAVQHLAAEWAEDAASPEPPWHVDNQQAEHQRCRTLRVAADKLCAALDRAALPASPAPTNGGDER